MNTYTHTLKKNIYGRPNDVSRYTSVLLLLYKLWFCSAATVYYQDTKGTVECNKVLLDETASSLSLRFLRLRMCVYVGGVVCVCGGGCVCVWLCVCDCVV